MCGGHVVWLAVWRRGWGEVNHVFVYIWKGEAGVGGAYCLARCGDKSVGWGYAIHLAQRAQ